MKLIVVEDEALCRETLVNLPWDSIGIEVAGEAESANAALTLVKDIRPDIVISDISMDDGDGFYLARELSCIVPNCKVIFLTAHDKFEYAQEAVNCNVFSLILKPINDALILKTVAEAKTELEEAYRVEEEHQRLINRFTECKFFLSEYFFSLAENNPDKLREYFGVGNGGEQYQSIVLSPSNDTEFNFRQFWNIGILLNQLTANRNIAFFNEKKLTLILWFSKDKTEDEKFDYVYNVANMLNAHVVYSGYEDLSYTISIGSPADSVEMIPYSVRRATDGLKYKFFRDENEVIYIDDIEPISHNICNLDEIKTDILNSIKTADADSTGHNIERLFDEFRRSSITLDFAQRICFEIIVAISIAMGQIGQNPEVIFKNSEIWSVLKKCNAIDELKTLLNGISATTCSVIISSRNDKYKNIVKDVLSILESNPDVAISLQDMAKRVYVSPCYLSSTFKQITGMSYKHYVVQMSINKARELLANTNITINKIAKQIGYKSPQYFSNIFKKETGLLPTEYRNMYQDKSILN